MYVNLWLSLSKYSLKATQDSSERVQSMITFLISLYDKRPYLSARNMTVDEVCSLLVSFSVLKVIHTPIHKDAVRVIEKNLDNLTTQHLVQLISVAKYISNYQNHSGKKYIIVDFYYIIHDRCVNTKETFTDAQIRIINRVLKKDGVVTKSPFL